MDKVMFYIGTGAVLLSVLYLLFWILNYWKGIIKDNTWNESYSNSVKNLLPMFIRDGFLLIFSGFNIGAILFFLEWSNILLLIPVVLFVFGLIELLVAWHLRQGLLYVGFVRIAVELRKEPRSIYWLLLFQIIAWVVLLVVWIKRSDNQLTSISGFALLIAGLSILFLLKLKKFRK